MKVFLSYPIKNDVKKITDIPLVEMVLALWVANELHNAGHQVRVGHITSDNAVVENAPGITGGPNWRTYVEESIRISDYFVALLSQDYFDSPISSWELLMALKHEREIIPVKVGYFRSMPSSLNNYQALEGGDIMTTAGVILQIVESGTGVRKYSKPYVSIAELDSEVQKSLNSLPPIRTFIAYSHAQRNLVEKLYELLFRKNGLAVFYDAKIRAGTAWGEVIHKALEDATHIILIWSSEAATSKWVKREIAYALEESKVIIPILLKDAPKLPYDLRELHRIFLCEDDISTIESDLLKALNQNKTNEDIWQ